MDYTLANRLVEARKINRYSQENLAEKLGLSRQAISKWERAESIPDTENLLALAKLYGMTLDELIGTEINKPENYSSQNSQAPKSISLKEDTQNQACAEPTQINSFIPDSNPTILSDSSAQKTDNKTETGTSADFGSTLQKRRQIRHNLITFPFALIIIIAYVAISYFTRKWDTLWLIFLSLPIYYLEAIAICMKTKRGFLMTQPVPFLCIAFYLCSGILYSIWLKSLLVFLIIPLYYWIATLASAKKK